MYKVDIALKGVAPLRMNRLDPERIRKPPGKQSREQLIKYAEEKKVYKNKNGYYIEAKAIKKAIIQGGNRVRSGKRAASTDLKAILQIPIMQVPLLNSKGKQYKQIDGIHEEIVRIPPGSDNAVIAFWPMFNIGWQVRFTAEIWDDRIVEDILKNSILEAGIYVGLLDGRPAWGRFKLDKFKRV